MEKEGKKRLQNLVGRAGRFSSLVSTRDCMSRLMKEEKDSFVKDISDLLDSTLEGQINLDSRLWF